MTERKRMRRLLALVTALGATAGMAQQPPPAEGARELFFAGAAPKDALPPVRQSAPAKAAPATVPPASQPGRATSGSAAALGAVHLGLRYNLLLVSARGDRGQPVDPDRNFRKGIPGKVSGAWVFKDTRMPVATVFENLEAGLTAEEVMEEFDVSREQLNAVLKFAAKSLHPC